MLVSTQRPVPDSGHSTSKGSGRRRSPNATIGAENTACAWRTPLTVPRGENALTRGTAGCDVAGTARERSENISTRLRVARIRTSHRPQPDVEVAIAGEAERAC